ncbi:hypothetical protein CRUP_024965 [Coryphaenoides rupestris]|nr:hypothetical protein CRUP_024965 [Coryphaenoides rupestris]
MTGCSGYLLWFWFLWFIPGPWTPCSATCGPGRQSRELKCKVLLSFTQTEVELPDEECRDDRTPLERPCNVGSCAGGAGPLSPPGGLPGGLGDELHHWDYRGFTACSATCAAEIFLSRRGGTPKTNCFRGTGQRIITTTVTVVS